MNDFQNTFGDHLSFYYKPACPKAWFCAGNKYCSDRKMWNKKLLISKPKLFLSAHLGICFLNVIWNLKGSKSNLYRQCSVAVYIISTGTWRDYRIDSDAWFDLSKVSLDLRKLCFLRDYPMPLLSGRGWWMIRKWLDERTKGPSVSPRESEKSKCRTVADFFLFSIDYVDFPGDLVVKGPPANVWNVGWILGLGSSPGGGKGNPLQYSCLENPKDRGGWWATVHGVTKSWAWLSD